MIKKIRLNQYRHVDAETKDLSVTFDMSNNKSPIRENQYNELINEYSTYLNEREACRTIRLTAQVNMVASNVLFNHITEVVKNEDSNSTDDTTSRKCLNFVSQTITSSYGKPQQQWGSDINDCIRDTQITYDGDEEKNYTYHCGLDIFNNHVLRSKTLIPNYYLANVSDSNFNTIKDYLCDENGRKLKSKAWQLSDFDKYLHIYQSDNILSFKKAIAEKLKAKDGWYGFINCAKMPTYDEDGNYLGIDRVINNKSVNSFIDLYPGKDCYTIFPYYNRLEHKKEKNWEYCLTYPYSSTTEGFSFINPSLDTLVISHIDENTTDADELQKTVIYSLAKHGLMENDLINLYRSTVNNTSHELIEENVIVDSIIDDYTFSVYLSETICQQWISVYDTDAIQGKQFFSSHVAGSDKYYYANDTLYVKSFNQYINADFDSDGHIGSQNLSFAKVVNNEQCKYYVRIFSRLPNFNDYKGELSESVIYDNDKEILNEYSDIFHEVQTTNTKLGFSKNIYGDNISQIVFDDNIGFDLIKDNLGRPLTSVYLSFFKTNYGRKEWYNGNLKSENIEHSHCFGKLNCGFKLSPYADSEKYKMGNINVMNNIDSGYCGLNQVLIRDSYEGYDFDEIYYSAQTYFYGDLCEYSAYNCKETVLQPILHRFNTQQRELKGSGLSMTNKFNPFYYDEVYDDDYNQYAYEYTIMTYLYNTKPIEQREGYYYISSYEVPIRTFSENVSTFTPDYFTLSSLLEEDGIYKATTVKQNYFNNDTDMHLYDISTSKSYKCKILNILDVNIVSFSLYNEDGTEANLDLINADVDNYRVYAREENIPSYAYVSEDGSGVFRWRDVVENGFEETSGLIDEYPFTNGCLYINKQLNIFLRRQDPHGYFGISNNNGITILSGEIASEEDSSTSNDSINESNSIC